MKSVSANGTTIYIPVHRWSKYDKVPCLRAQVNSNSQPCDYESDVLPLRLTRPSHQLLFQYVNVGCYDIHLCTHIMLKRIQPDVNTICLLISSFKWVFLLTAINKRNIEIEIHWLTAHIFRQGKWCTCHSLNCFYILCDNKQVPATQDLPHEVCDSYFTIIIHTFNNHVYLRLSKQWVYFCTQNGEFCDTRPAATVTDICLVW